MGLDALLTSIETRGEQEREEILQSAKERAERILAQAQKAAQNEANAILSEHDVNLDVSSQREKSAAEIRLRKKLTMQKNQIVQDIFDEVIHSIYKLRNDKNYGEIYKTLYLETIKDLPENLILYTNPEDESLLKQLISQSDKSFTTATDSSIDCGIIARSRDGTFTRINTLQSRLEKKRKDLLVWLGKELFSGIKVTLDV